MARRKNLTLSIDAQLAAKIEAYRDQLRLSEIASRAFEKAIEELEARTDLRPTFYSVGVQDTEEKPKDVLVTSVEPVNFLTERDILARLAPEDRARYEQMSEEGRACVMDAARAGTVDAWRVRRASLSNFE